MFGGFKLSLPQISIFHHASSPPSIKALSLLRSSLQSAYPPQSSSPPLQFNLEVVESPPTPDQLKTILSFHSPRATQTQLSSFLSAHPSTPSGSEQPKSASEVAKLAAQNPNAFKWPVVVDWTGGMASIGDVEGVKGILEVLRQQRDGEVKREESEHKPKGWFS